MSVNRDIVILKQDGTAYHPQSKAPGDKHGGLWDLGLEDGIKRRATDVCGGLYDRDGLACILGEIGVLRLSSGRVDALDPGRCYRAWPLLRRNALTFSSPLSRVNEAYVMGSDGVVGIPVGKKWGVTIDKRWLLECMYDSKELDVMFGAGMCGRDGGGMVVDSLLSEYGSRIDVCENKVGSSLVGEVVFGDMAVMLESSWYLM